MSAPTIEQVRALSHYAGHLRDCASHKDAEENPCTCGYEDAWSSVFSSAVIPCVCCWGTGDDPTVDAPHPHPQPSCPECGGSGRGRGGMSGETERRAWTVPPSDAHHMLIVAEQIESRFPHDAARLRELASTMDGAESAWRLANQVRHMSGYAVRRGDMYVVPAGHYLALLEMAGIPVHPDAPRATGGTNADA